MYLQALVQIAVALHKLGEGRPDVALRLLDRALAKLEGCPSHLDGVALARFARDARSARDAIARGETVDVRIHATDGTDEA